MSDLTGRSALSLVVRTGYFSALAEYPQYVRGPACFCLWGYFLPPHFTLLTTFVFLLLSVSAWLVSGVVNARGGTLTPVTRCCSYHKQHQHCSKYRGVWHFFYRVFRITIAMDRHGDSNSPGSSSSPSPVHGASYSPAGNSQASRRSYQGRPISASRGDFSPRQTPAARSYTSVIRGPSSRHSTLAATLQHFAANIASFWSSEVREYTLLPSAPTSTGSRINTFAENEQGENISDFLKEIDDEHNTIPAFVGGQDREWPLRISRSYPETTSEQREMNENHDNAPQIEGREVEQSVVSSRQSYLHPGRTGSKTNFSNKARSDRRDSHMQPRHGCSKLSACSHRSQVSRTSTVASRPTPTIVVGSEHREGHPNVIEMKTALVQRALDENGMGRYQWCM